MIRAIRKKTYEYIRLVGRLKHDLKNSLVINNYRKNPFTPSFKVSQVNVYFWLNKDSYSPEFTLMAGVYCEAGWIWTFATTNLEFLLLSMNSKFENECLKGCTCVYSLTRESLGVAGFVQLENRWNQSP